MGERGKKCTKQFRLGPDRRRAEERVYLRVARGSRWTPTRDPPAVPQREPGPRRVQPTARADDRRDSSDATSTTRGCSTSPADPATTQARSTRRGDGLRSTSSRSRWRAVRRADSVVSDATRLALGDGCVDGVVCSNLIEHTSTPAAVIDEMQRVVRPGGWIWLSWTNWYSPYGGHDMSPWHYLGPRLGLKAYRRVKRADPIVARAQPLPASHRDHVARASLAAGHRDRRHRPPLLPVAALDREGARVPRVRHVELRRQDGAHHLSPTTQGRRSGATCGTSRSGELERGATGNERTRPPRPVGECSRSSRPRWRRSCTTTLRRNAARRGRSRSVRATARRGARAVDLTPTVCAVRRSTRSARRTPRGPATPCSTSSAGIGEEAARLELVGCRRPGALRGSAPANLEQLVACCELNGLTNVHCEQARPRRCAGEVRIAERTGRRTSARPSPPIAASS